MSRLVDQIAPDWHEALVRVRPDLDELLAGLEAFVDGEISSGRGVLPARDHLLRAFAQPLAQVRVLLIGQDPYPTPGHAVGLSFSTAPDVRPLPRSLVNVFTEREADLGVPPSVHGDLSAWADQGVLLLNRVLSVGPGEAGSHRRRGWESLTDAAVDVLARRHAVGEGPCVALLWGRDAQAVAPRLGAVPRVESAHPSPLSARRGFFGSRPFSQVNALLAEQGADPVHW
ncbi:uracil-DNA glycosylase [Nocardioides yefusunii]|uniref:Uracil-DNA glycosylase n=1 Tax=Nocardioides yefusunii TaxID=2500546 RepID=A0ABW1QXQ5_9ACTN|nr:uracil-DNA glycosylase [Nocardioides yefusunii]